jgi:hypothetical protein
LSPPPRPSCPSSPQTAISSILPLYSGIPIPPAELQTVSLPSDPCETPALTGDLADEYTSYTSELLGWYTAHSSELFGALSGCSELSDYATDVPVCSTEAAEGTKGPYGASATATGKAPESATVYSSGAAGTSASAAASTKASGPSGASAVATAGAAHENGFIAGVIAVIAFVGAVAAL